jgi:hypothetical protein
MKENEEEPRLMAQWIVSLAVSVVCCAVLFVVFAGYIVDIHDSLNLTKVRLEVAQERVTHLNTEVDALRRALMPPQPYGRVEAAPAGSSAPVDSAGEAADTLSTAAQQPVPGQVPATVVSAPTTSSPAIQLPSVPTAAPTESGQPAAPANATVKPVSPSSKP